MQTLKQPATVFWTDPSSVCDANGSPLLKSECDGRKGWYRGLTNTPVAIPVPQINEPQGSLILWVLPREDFATSVNSPWMASREPEHYNYVLLGDTPDAARMSEHRFALVYSRSWYDQMYAKWHRGDIYDFSSGDGMYIPGREKAFVSLGHLNLTRGHWMQIGLTWNEAKNDCRLFLNGLLVQTSTSFDYPLLREANSGTIHAGHPLFSFGEMAVFDEVLSEEDFCAAYAENAPAGNGEIDRALHRTHSGKSVPALRWSADGDWEEKTSLPLNRPEDLARFYVQGMTQAPTITPEGLRVHTSDIPVCQLEKPADWSSEEPWDPTQVYLWLEDHFSGDFAVEYEFKALQNHGLSLLMVRAASLHGDEFLKTQPRRISGAMRLVCWENVRNYHWEYYRQLEGARIDVASHVLVKNPYLHPLAYQVTDSKLAPDQWHKIQFVHEANRLRGAIDGLQIFDVTDDPFAGFGPVFRTGTLAIRCMAQTDMVFRNLKVWTKPEAF
jgi:hypothetical protein